MSEFERKREEYCWLFGAFEVGVDFGSDLHFRVVYVGLLAFFLLAVLAYSGVIS